MGNLKTTLRNVSPNLRNGFKEHTLHEGHMGTLGTT
jgi:hypothetical protein